MSIASPSRSSDGEAVDAVVPLVPCTTAAPDADGGDDGGGGGGIRAEVASGLVAAFAAIAGFDTRTTSNTSLDNRRGDWVVVVGVLRSSSIRNRSVSEEAEH
jgi:hypothetical protein